MTIHLVSMDKIQEWLSKISTISGISGISILAIVTFIYKNRKHIKEFFLRKVPVMSKGYYTDKFLMEHINNVSRSVTIFCVRNLRVSEADILQELKKACDRGVEVKIYWLSPDVNETIIEKIMPTLPTPPSSVAMFKEQVETSKARIIEETKRWSNDAQRRIHLYAYNALPTIHFCQFDNKIYLGFQIFDPNDDLGGNQTKKLGDYAIIIKAKSDLGKLILRQVEMLTTSISIIY